MFSRRRTDPALDRDRARQRRPTLPYEVKPSRVQDKFTAYDDFSWEEIRAFLQQKWPSWTDDDFKPQRFNDYWQFEIPEELSDGDRRALRERRDAKKRTRRPSF